MSKFVLDPSFMNKQKNNKEEKKKTETKTTEKHRPDLTSDQVENLNFFKEDLESLDKEVEEAGALYDKFSNLYNQIVGQEYITRSVRDVAELSKSMVSARSYRAQAINNRIALKKTIADLNFRSKGGIDTEGSEASLMAARQVINLVRKEIGEPIGNTMAPKTIDKRTNEGKKRAEEESKLEDVLNKKISSGEISMSKNDNLVGTNDHVVIRYDKNTESFVGVDNRTGDIIPNFPKSRLPDAESLSKVNRNSAVLESGEEIKLFDKLEFDDGYIDDAP